MTDRQRFARKSVIVTGAAQGIGRGVALAIAAEGGRVLAVDRSSIVNEVVDEIVEAGGHADPFEADLEQFSGGEAMVAEAQKQFRHVDVLINVVGGTIWRQPFEEYTAEQIEKEIRRSLYPTLWGCRAVLPPMIKRKRGVIVNVSSIATRSIYRVPYAAAKGGVNALTASIAMEQAGNGIRINATAPGGTEAPPRRIARNDEKAGRREKTWHKATETQTVESTLMGRFGTIDEQVAPILFFASDESSYITGSVLPVGGGDLG